MKLSVVIPCYNGAETIGTQLDALVFQEWSESWEVVVVDNGSTDRSMEIVAAYRGRIPNLRVVDASARQGQPFALNIGVQAAAGESVALCDADDEVAPGWVAAMGNALLKNDLVGCRMEIEKLNPPWLLKSRGNPQDQGIQPYIYPRYLNHVGGGTLGFKKRLWEEVGGFDEDYPMLHDTDFCWKAQLMGAKLEFVADAVMHIRFRDSIKGIYRQARGYAEYNVKIYKKYRSINMPSLNVRVGLLSHFRFVRRFVRSLPGIRTREDIAVWAWNVGWHWGRLKGSIKHRVFAL